MKTVEEQLTEEKLRVDAITAPEELEVRLRNAVNTATLKRSKRIAPIWKIAAVVLLVTVITGNNYNAFAYYGKKLLGFDDVIHGTLQQLNDEGMGQLIDKKTTLVDGTDLIINGIISDANQFVMYYTLTNPNGLEDYFSGSTGTIFSPAKISGFLTNSNVGSGESLMNENHTEIKGTLSFDSVSPFAKNLTLYYWQSPIQNGQMIEGTITFPYNPNQAMQTQIKKSLNKKVKVDKGTITFKSITATPTMTMIEGSMNVTNFDRGDTSFEGIELIANGTPIDLMGSGTQSSLGRSTFDIRYDTLPKELDSLELVIKEFIGYQKLDEKLSLASIGNEPYILEGRKLWIKDVSKTTRGMEITIATDDDVMLNGVSIATKDEITSLNTTINQKSVEQKDGKVLKERTLLFDTSIQPEELILEGMHYTKAYNKVIEIPVD